MGRHNVRGGDDSVTRDAPTGARERERERELQMLVPVGGEGKKGGPGRSRSLRERGTKNLSRRSKASNLKEPEAERQYSWCSKSNIGTGDKVDREVT